MVNHINNAPTPDRIAIWSIGEISWATDLIATCCMPKKRTKKNHPRNSLHIDLFSLFNTTYQSITI